ncbi:MAG TPA: hypothetical protein VFR89_07055, partial [candidate division Zixibacteria bacterium]|nr:hypothetical protein [candidate division Zixibacteria bacterium]
MKSKRILTLLVGLLLVMASLAWAQPRPGDQLVIESKTVLPGLNAPNAVLLKLSITNVDSLTFLTWASTEYNLSGDPLAYILFNNGPGATGRTFTNLVNPLTGTLRYFAATAFANYNDASPDRFLIAAGFDPADPTTIEPPNVALKDIWELRFKSTTVNEGQVIFDTGTVSGLRNTFTNTGPTDFPVNYTPGIVTIQSPA